MKFKMPIEIQMLKNTFNKLMVFECIVNPLNQEKYRKEHGIKIIDNSFEIGYCQAKFIYIDSSTEIIDIIEQTNK